MMKTLLAAILLVATSAGAEQIIPITPSAEGVATHEIRLRNLSALDGATVTLAFVSDGHTASDASPVRIEAGDEIVLSDVVGLLFGMTPDAIGEIRASAPESVEVLWRVHRPGSSQNAWLPSVTSVAPLTVGGRRRSVVCAACRVDPPTLVKAGDVATFRGSHGVSGVATIIDRNTLRVSALKHDGSAPGLDIRVGLSTTSRRNFAVVRVTGRQVFQDATLDLALPAAIDLNSFDTFTVWCYEFNSIIAEGKFQRP